MRTTEQNVLTGSVLETRNITARVSFNIQSLDSHAKLISDDKTSLGNGLLVVDELLNDGITFPSNYPATLEKDNLLLDGSRVTTDKLPEQTQLEYKLKYYKDSLSDKNCVLTEPKAITFNCVNRDDDTKPLFVGRDIPAINGIFIAFDLFDRNYATDFVIELYSKDEDISEQLGDKKLVQTIKVTNNNKEFYQYVGTLPVFNEMKITFTKINKPFQTLKIAEVGLGIQKVYEDDIFNLTFTEEIDITLNSLPANSLKVTVEDANNEFDTLNPNNTIKFIQNNAPATLFIGVFNGGWFYVDMGTYFLRTYTKNEDDSVTFDFMGLEEIEDNLSISKTTNTNDFFTLSDKILINTKSIYANEKIKYTSDTIDPYSHYKNKYKSIANPNIDPENIPSIREWLKYMQSATCAVFKPYSKNNIFYTKFIDLLSNKKSGLTIDLANSFSYPSITYEEETVEVTLKGHSAISGKDDDVVKEVSLIKANETGQKISIDNPYWTGSNIKEVANYLMYNKPNTTISCNWRGCPAIEVGDWVDVETKYNTINGIVTKQEFSYNGALSCKTSVSTYSRTPYVDEDLAEDTPEIVEDDGSQGTVSDV